MSSRELVEVSSFDGERVSGFLYRPDPARFPGRRPLIVNIHGGPESQSRPGFLGRNNYLINELGIAIFYPNVRGSTGYGKRFVSLDNGPARRENSVADIGAFLDRLRRDPALDPARFAVTGGSYGGYMCYASAIRFGDRLRAANCVVAISNWVTFLENTQSLSPRPEARRIWRRARPRPARGAGRDQPADPGRRAAHPADGGDRRQRSAGAAPRRPTRWSARSAPPAARPGICSAERGPRLRQEGESGLSILGRA